MIISNSNEYMRNYVACRYAALKLRAVKYKGSGCKSCGYDKCISALEFHHRDSSTKDFDWGKLRKQSWEMIVSELDKCDLLCANCHREVHYNGSHLSNAVKYLESLKKTPAVNKLCCLCNKEFSGRDRRKYCSAECSRKSKERIMWPSNLVELVSATSKAHVARSLGVSDVAVRKRLNGHFA